MSASRSASPLRRHRGGLCATALLLLLAPVNALARDVTVFAAASLKTALDTAIATYEGQTGKDITVSYAASGPLARQIIAGAPADVFISANEAWMDTLAEQHMILPDSRRVLLSNSLVLVGPAGSPPVTIDSSLDLAGLLKGGRLSIGHVQSVPAGTYAREALESLGLWAGVRDRLAMSDTVRAALTLVSRGEAPLGIVYATDARVDPGVVVLGTFPAGSHTPITYPAALVGDAGGDARAFLAWLSSPAAKGPFEAEGFTVLP